ncbi:3-oxoacyl-[acyl-carrier-protein] reductase FabG-like [Vanessa atalanta]|uniref:3-oxoacyl-[acyl-carrier-protein] reductase FabG-like n=1 Tax=Vanessa atalanta TaxID=42275 RepID=UPI001FCE1498|nr:3-oxoacyl-[acyl-carrier-protein] reductase FabG-like [Vanessa atalanta]
MSFKNKVVIVTGASSGIGAAASKMFSKEGARVVMVGRNETKLAAVAAQCNSPLVLRADVSNDDDARRIIDQTVKKNGHIDVLVNNAGMTMANGGILGTDMMKSYDTIMNTNLRAVVHLSNLAAPYLVKTKGNIVNISSIAGTIPPIGPGLTNYYVSKAALNHFTVCAAKELGPHGVRVNVISPGPVRTDFMDNVKDFYGTTGSWDDFMPKTILNRVSEPDEIADMILYLASDKAKSVTGSNFVIDNGMLIKRT